MPYEGKIIRQIKIEALDFEKNFTDTTKRVVSFAGRLANLTHTNTRAFVVRNNLFIKENTPVNAYKIADNERYLRTLNYIHDARIIIDTLADNPDSVDIIVVTKDFFNLSADGASNGLNHVNLHLVDANIAGMGQAVEATGLYDYNRHPDLAYGGLYRKDNVCHSFIDATVGYSLMNINPYTGEEETSEYIRLARPLVSPYARFAGGLTLSHDVAYNSYNLPDSVFFRYNYSLYDGWIGYNIGIKKLTATNNTIRDRRFFAVRYFNYDFTQVPGQVGKNFDPVFNSKQAILGQFTFFRQDYYKTQYIYGFGTTEDLPYGYNISLTGGWYKQLSLERPYAGFSATRYIATGKGDFIQLFLRAGGYLNKDHLQDASFLAGGTVYGRIFFIGSTKMRPYFNFSYTHLYDRVTSQPLYINNDYGIGEFLSDSVHGTQRLTVQVETPFYLKYKLLGFQFAPFPHADLSLVTGPKEPYYKSQLYSGLGGGIRARNENLVFETIELRFYYYPIAPDGMRGFKVILNSNIRFRYVSNLISAPDVVQLNTAQ